MPCVEAADAALEPLPDVLAALAAFLSLEIFPPLPLDGCLDPPEAVAPAVSLPVVELLELSVTVSFRLLELRDHESNVSYRQHHGHPSFLLTSLPAP